MTLDWVFADEKRVAFEYTITGLPDILKEPTPTSHPLTFTPTDFLPLNLLSHSPKMRVTNQSPFTIHNLHVRFPGEWVEFRDVLTGTTPEYRLSREAFTAVRLRDRAR